MPLQSLLFAFDRLTVDEGIVSFSLDYLIILQHLASLMIYDVLPFYQLYYDTYMYA